MVTQTSKYWLVLFTFFCAICFAEEQSFDFQNPVKAEIIYEYTSIQPNQPFWVGIRLELENGWHAYWKNPGDAGMPPQIEWDLPEQFSVGEILWPSPKKFTAMDAVGYGYENEVTLLAKVTPPSTISGPVEIKANVSWVVCNDSSCLPGNANIQTSLISSTTEPKLHKPHTHLFAKARKSLPKDTLTIQGSRQNGLFSIPLKLNEPIHAAAFYPEHPERIDPTEDPVITDDGAIALKDLNPENPDPLIGVVVLNNKHIFNIHVSPNTTINKNSASNPNPPLDQENIHQFKGSVGLAIILAFLGGLILNCMPCVLPVISFKILGFVKMAGESRRLIFKHGLAFSFGVLLSFWALAGVLLLLQSWGHAVGWGFQLQEPLFVGILASIILVFGLSLFGVFELGAGMASFAGQASTRSESGLASSFFSGILATAVATPCTGPFLGTAIGFAVTLPAFQSLMIFSSLGLGMAAPYLLFAAFPGLLKWMPKPGNWMVIFKEIMGFVMIATVLWLVWVFGAQTGTFAVFILLAGFFCLAIGCWIFGKWGSPIKKKQVRLISLALTAAAFSLGGFAIIKASGMSSTLPQTTNITDIAMADANPSKLTDRWIPFSPELLEKLQTQNVPVFIDFTAKWCLICQANHVTLETDQVRSVFQKKGVVKMLADWTKSDPVIAKWLKKFGRNGVPLYVLYNEKNEAEVLPQVLTPEIVIKQLRLLPDSDSANSSSFIPLEAKIPNFETRPV